MPTISWLHLTDLHFNTNPRSGMASQGWLWPNVREKFFQDIDRLHRQMGGGWDLVFFTGDLAQSGTPEDYAALDRDVLARLWEQFRRLGCNPKLLAIPGNHDLKWPSKFSGTARALRAWPTDKELRDHFWDDETSEYRELIREVFRPYTEWWEHTPYRAGIRTEPGLLPGDFSASFEKDSVRLGIVGLNSAFLQLGGGVKEGELLDVDPRQLHEVCGDDVVDWTKAHDINLLMTHHPLAWLNPAAQKEFRSELSPAGRFFLHLFGHMHEPRAEFTQSGGSRMKRELQGASLFGLEKWETPQGTHEQRIHGYTGGRFQFEDGEGSLRLWPRKYVKSQDDSQIRADFPMMLDDEESIEVPFG
jgi:3',5'-cyclic AMP phosphodiesterase CpdA